MANIHERALLADVLEPRGSGFVGKHGDDLLLANDPAWVGFSVEIGPDGAVYILDWHDGDICGMSTQHKGTGRIFRYAPKGLPGKSGLDLAAKSDLELVELQRHRNDWYVRRARVLLQERAAAGRLEAGTGARLWEMFAQAPTAGDKLRALWALHVTNQLPAARAHALLDHGQAHVRAWAVQLLCEDKVPGEAARAKFAEMARNDRSAVVRLALASALQRLPLAQRWEMATALAARAEDNGDHNLPHMIWFGVEPLVEADATKALALAARAGLPMITNYIARRATAAKRTDAVVAALASAQGPALRPLLEGLRDGLATLGPRDAIAPANWSAVEPQLTAGAGDGVRDLVGQIGQLFGDAKAAAAQLALLQDRSVATERRREILQAFVRNGTAAAVPAVIGLLDEAVLRRDAIRALASFDDGRVGSEILRRYAQWPAAERAEAVLTLAARRTTAEGLLAALRAGRIEKRDVSAFTARQLQRVIGPAFVDFWGPVAQPAADKQAEIARLKRTLTDEVLARGSAAAGRAVFERTCAACHTLYGEGGKIGPDITGSNRGNLDYILTEIINPSEVIQDGYHLVTIATRDGRTLAGNLAAEDDQRVTLRLIGQETVVAKADIVSREVSPVSMMPEGMLQNLTADEVRDLIVYLRTTAPVPAGR
jgi:putative heme-binding domain-containing protein